MRMISFNKKNKGFALIELLCVILVIACLLIFAVDEYIRYIAQTRITRANVDIDELIKAVRLYNIKESNRFEVDVFMPNKLGSFIGRYLDKEPPMDPWGKPYKHSADMGVVYSMGPDGKDSVISGDIESDDVVVNYLPKDLFITRAEYVDHNGTNQIDFDDYIELTFSRPVVIDQAIGLDFETDNPKKALGTVKITSCDNPFKGRITLIPPIMSHFVIGETTILPREFIESIYDRSPAHQKLQRFDSLRIEKRKN